MVDFTPWSSLAGGLLVGLSAAIVLLYQGRIAGISGMCGVVLRPTMEGAPWRFAFLAGLLVTGLVLLQFTPASFDTSAVPSSGYAIAAGLLVGFGTRLGNGCTSGHGVCGISRLSPRSLVATATFITTGALTVFVVRHLVGAGG